MINVNFDRRFIIKMTKLLSFLIILFILLPGCASQKEQIDYTSPESIVSIYLSYYNNNTKVDEMVGLWDPNIVGTGEDAKKFRSILNLSVQRNDVESFQLSKPIYDGDTCYIKAGIVMKLSGNQSIKDEGGAFTEKSVYKLSKINEKWLIQDTKYKGSLPNE